MDEPRKWGKSFCDVSGMFWNDDISKVTNQ